MTLDGLAWAAADWGTSNLRVWAMSESGTVLAEATSDKGMGRLDQNGFEPALLDLIGDWKSGPLTVVACGMVGSRQGWVEAAYSSTPCNPLSDNLARPKVNDSDLDVFIVPGIKQLKPADVMRGEETQIAGFLALNPGWDGVLCLPGTHTKWVQVSAGEVVSFQTFMTGELFALIGSSSVLRHSIGDGWDADAFTEALSDAMGKPERLAARLFSLRAESLLADLAPAAARARLSGLLIGSELAAAKPYWIGQNIAVVGAGGLSRLYVDALAAQAALATQTNGDRVTLAGLTTAYRKLKG